MWREWCVKVVLVVAQHVDRKTQARSGVNLTALSQALQRISVAAKKKRGQDFILSSSNTALLSTATVISTHFMLYLKEEVRAGMLL